MRALISGQAGVAVMLDDDRAVSIDVECQQPVVRGPEEWPHLLEGADDAYELNDVSEQQVIGELDLAWRKDRTLHLMLILLDSDTERETRKESAELLENLVADERVLTHTLNRLHVAPIPATADLKGAIGIVRKRHPGLEGILQEVSDTQEAIARSRQAWELLPPDLFGSALAKESFGFEAVEHGLFAAMSSGREIDLTRYSSQDREVVRRWRREIKSLESDEAARQRGASSDGDTAPDSGLSVKRKPMSRMIALVAAACIVLGVVLTAVLINARPVEASSVVRLGTSQPGFQVVEAPLTGLQRELYGSILISYVARNASKKTAERLFVSGEADARAGNLPSAATAFRESNASFPTIAARLNEAVALFNTSQLPQAERLLKATLPDAEHSGSKLLIAAIFTDLGHVDRTQGRFDDAEQAYSKALAIDRESKNRTGEAADLDNLALALSSRGKLVKGLEGFMEALSVAEEARADAVAADSRLNIALTLTSFGRMREAEQNFRSAAAYYEGHGSPLGQAYYNFAYGQYMYAFDLAARFYGGTAPKEIDQMLLYSRRALGLYESVSNKSGQAIALLAIGAALRAKGESQEALDQYRKALRLTEEIGDLPGQEVAFREIGAWYFGVKEYDPAIENLERALDIARRIGNFGGECVALEQLGLIMSVAGKPDLALKYSNEAADVSLKSGDAFVQAAAYDDLGFALYKLFDKNIEALTALKRAYNIYSEVDSPLRDGTRMLMDSVRNHKPAREIKRDRLNEPRQLK